MAALSTNYIKDTDSTKASQNCLDVASDSDTILTDADIKEEINNAGIIAKQNLEKIKGLNEAFEQLSNVAKQTLEEVDATKDTVKIIQDIAMNTRILGFNASIEASRAKESGKGFGVIAQEVRNLAETSKVSADKIDEIMKRMTDCTKELNEKIEYTEKIAVECYENLSEFIRCFEQLQNNK